MTDEIIEEKFVDVERNKKFRFLNPSQVIIFNNYYSAFKSHIRYHSVRIVIFDDNGENHTFYVKGKLQEKERSKK